MIQVTPTQVRHIAGLARLRLSEEEVEKFSRELSSILKYVQKLQEVDTQGIVPTSQVTGLSNISRPDVLSSSHTLPDALLATSPLPVIEHQIQTPSTHG